MTIEKMNVQELERIIRHYLASEGGLTLVTNFSGAVLTRCTLKEERGNSLLTVTYDDRGVSFYVSCSGQHLPVKYICMTQEVPELEKWYQGVRVSTCSDNTKTGATIPSSVTWIGGFSDPPSIKKPAQNKKAAAAQAAA